MWKVQTGERAPFWCTLLVFTQSDGQCFMPPIIMHKAKEYSQYLHFSIPLYWTFHNTPSGYMYIERWLKSMNQFSNVCGAFPVNNQILLFDGHDSHFDNCVRGQIKCRNIQPFVLFPVDTINKHPNDNGPNDRLWYIYNVEKT